MIFLIIATIIWALSFSIIGNYLSSTIDPWSLSLLRVIISFLIFLPFLVYISARKAPALIEKAKELSYVQFLFKCF